MDHETSKPDSSAWVDDRMASLKSSASWTPDADRAYRELSQRTARPAGVPWLRLSLAGVTVTALVLVVAMLPWSQVWKPSETPKPTGEQSRDAQAKPEAAVDNGQSRDVTTAAAEQQPAVNLDARNPLESTSAAPKTVEAKFAETAQQLTGSSVTGSPDTRCKKTYNCQPIPGTGLAAIEKAPSKGQQQLTQAVQPIQVPLVQVPPIQSDERTRLERQKIEDARRAGPIASTWSSEPYQASPQSGVTEPVLVYQVQPRYTEEAKAVRIQGTVHVDITVNTDGSVTFESIRQSLGYGLDESARDAVVQWRFAPGTKDGAPVRTRVTVTMNFSLK